MSTMDTAWSPVANTVASLNNTGAPGSLNRPVPGGQVVRCGVRSSSAGSQTRRRVADDVAVQNAQRIGTMAILTSITVLAAAILQHALQPQMAAAQLSPLYRLSALFLVLAGAALAAVQRAEVVNPQELLDLGLLFEIAGAGAIAFIENAAPWPDSAVRGTTVVAAWIAICVVVIPNKPWKSMTAAIASAAMVPCTHLVAAQILGYPPLPWNRMAGYTMGAIFVAAWTPFICTRIYRMHEDLSRTQEFGSYHLERLLGRGGMGEVWVARHRFLRREAAVKLVLDIRLARIGMSERRQVQKRFELEAQAIASLRSPHTVELYDYGLTENGAPYYAMEYLQGMDAERLVEQHGPQPAGRVIAFLRQACESLEEAHDAGLVHRDIKASNIFICRLGKRTDFVKILDFGLVKSLADPSQTALTTHAEASGTPAFMAPEQVQGEPVDARTDIYGLGCVAYFLLTGTVVFHKRTATATLLAHVTERPEPPSKRSELQIPASLERTIMTCLEKSREARPQSIADFRAMLDGCSDVTPWTQADADQWWNLHRPEPVHTAPA